MERNRNEKCFYKPKEYLKHSIFINLLNMTVLMLNLENFNS